MVYENLEVLNTRLTDVWAARGSLDCLLTVGLSEQVTIAVWAKKEPHTIEAPINLKWLKGDTMYVRTSRSPSGNTLNTWMPIYTIAKALEPQKWDRAKPANWDLLQHSTNIDDPHQSRGEFAGGDLFGPLKLWVDQPIGDNYAASQKFVDAKLALFKPDARFEYASETAKTEHVIEHGKNTLTPSVAIYVERQMALTEVEVVNADTVIVRFPYPEMCEVGIL